MKIDGRKGAEGDEAMASAEMRPKSCVTSGGENQNRAGQHHLP